MLRAAGLGKWRCRAIKIRSLSKIVDQEKVEKVHNRQYPNRIYQHFTLNVPTHPLLLLQPITKHMSQRSVDKSQPTPG